MKKRYKYLAICLVIWTSFGLTSCGSAQKAETQAQQNMTPEMYITQATESLQEAGSYVGKLEVLTETETESYHTVADLTKMNHPLKAHIDEHYTYGESKTLTEIYYIDETDNAVNIYRKYDGQWTAISLPRTEALKSMQFFDIGSNICVLLKNGQNWKEVSQNNQEIMFSGTISTQAVYDVINQTNLLQLSGVNGISEIYFTGVNDLEIQITMDKKQMVPLTCTIDLSEIQRIVTDNILKELQVPNDDAFLLNNYNMKMEIFNINQTQNIEFPKEINNAINYEQAIKDMNQKEEETEAAVS